WAFDSLYVMVNSRKYDSGLYRVRDTDGDGELDEVKLLRRLRGGGGEHGPHAIALHPDGKSLVVQHSNQTPLTQFDRTRVSPAWGPAAASSVGGTAPANGRRTIPIAWRPFSTSGPVRRPVSPLVVGRSFPASIRKRSSSATGATASSTPFT